MLNKSTFSSDDSLNAFFRVNTNHDGTSSIYLVKIIITYNPYTKQQEYHIIYSDKVVMKSGQHQRMGVKQ
jgi:hypothetical protein